MICMCEISYCLKFPTSFTINFFANLFVDAVIGWAGWAEFGSSVKPIPTKGAYYAQQITVCPKIWI